METSQQIRVAYEAPTVNDSAPVLDADSVRSVDRAAALLLALGSCPGDAGVTDIARRLGLHKSTASRLLSTLAKRGLVEHDEDTGKYRLGLALIRLGSHAERTLDLRAIALPQLAKLSRIVKQTVTIGAFKDDKVSTIAWSDASGGSHDRTGTVAPLHATAPGKVLLSSRPERDVIRLSRIGLTPYTSRTIIRADALLEEMARVRTRGFATAFGEFEPSVNAVAMPLYDHRGRLSRRLK